MTAARYWLHESREFWNVRTECCGADETFIGDAGSGGPVCRGCHAEITEWISTPNLEEAK